MKTLAKDNIEKLPENPGVYFLKNSKGPTFYIGKAINIKKRVKNHFARPTYWDKNFIDRVSKIGFIKTDSEIEALLLESLLIKSHKPKYNIMLRDDKQYFYVGFSQDKLPILSITHQPIASLKIKNKKAKIKNTTSLYIGPFTDGRALKTVLRYLRKVFPYYSSRHRILPCSYCHIDLCPGPDANTTEYKKNLTKLKAILRGQRPRVITSLKKEMTQAAKNLNFEKAAKTRNQIHALENIFRHKFEIRNPTIRLRSGRPERSRGTKSVLDSEGRAPPFEGPEALSGLEGRLGLERETNPNIQNSNNRNTKGLENYDLEFKDCFEFRASCFEFSSLEAYDISNIQGKEPVASMVRIENGKPNKSMYRKFKIRLPETPNDVAMIKEVVARRLAHGEWPYPDLMLIDGGRGQLNAALRQCRMSNVKCQIAALAKKFNELYLPGRKNPIPLDSLPREVKHALMYSRDEAHRFAISYHRKLHRKQSML